MASSSSLSLPVPSTSTSTPLTILTALTKSRNSLLFDSLPLFSTKSRSKSAPQLVQPPHTLSQIGTVNITIGPHSFPKTKFFNCDWLDTAPKKPTPPPPAPSPAPAPASGAAAITPALIMRLNAASAADPLLASILRKAAAGQANPQELSGLARYIQAMSREEEALNATTAAAAAKEKEKEKEKEELPPIPSIVIEFRESTTERFVLPPHYTCTALPSKKVLLSLFVFPSDKKDKGKGKGTEPVPIDIVLEECGEGLKKSLMKASRNGRERDEEVEGWWKRMILAVPLSTPIVLAPITPSLPPSEPLFLPSANPDPSGVKLSTPVVPIRRKPGPKKSTGKGKGKLSASVSASASPAPESIASGSGGKKKKASKPKPPKMHWKQAQRLRREAEAAKVKAEAEMDGK